jgi:chromatin licensing and DNA replication factor 1
MPERTFNGFSASKGTSTEFSMPVPTTCIPMEINTASHRVELPKSDRSPVLSSHFSKSFNSCFSLKAGGSFIRNAKKTKDVSPAGSEVRDTILPMPINRTSHRDVHNLAEKPNGTPHLATSFKPFFSVKRSSPEPERVAEDCIDSAPVSDIPSSSVQHSPLQRRHGESQKDPEIVELVELKTPMKIIRTSGISRPPTASEFESPNKRPHFSPAFKAHFSVSSSRMDHASSSLPSTPVKPSISKEAPICWDVRTPGRISDAVYHCSPIDGESSGLETPVKSSIPAHSFKSPAPVTPKKHQHSPCTPQVSECGESSVYVSYHTSQPGSACHDGFKSPAATPVKQGSAMRSLFGTPKSDSLTSSGVTGSPSMDVPSTPGMRTPMSTGSRFRNKEQMKQNLGSLFARSEDDDADVGNAGESLSCITTTSVAEKSTLRKSLNFASEVSQGDINITNRSGRAPESAGGVGC